jgi:hypothetical protein
MNAERKYFMDDSYLTEEEEKNLSRDVVNILDLFRLLSAEEKATVKRIIRNEKII